MKLEWMGEYRDVVEALIHYCKIYASVYRVEKMHYGDISYSYSQIQVLEYLLENEERGENMTAIANRLGITRSLYHGFYCIAKDLNAYRTLKFLKIKFLDAFHRVAYEAVGGDKLRVDHICTKHLADVAERRVGNILHRSEKERIMVKFEVGKFIHLFGFSAAKVQKVYFCTKIKTS